MKELVDILKHTKTHLMNGVSYMIPVVVGGGILMAIAVLLTGEGAAPGWVQEFLTGYGQSELMLLD